MHGKHELDHGLGPVAAGGSPAGADAVDLCIQTSAVCDALARKTAVDREWTPLLEACLADIEEAVEADRSAETPPLFQAVADFALIEHGTIKPGSRRGQQAVRVGRRCQARRLIASHLSQAALSPGLVADRLGVSVRYVHVLYETTGTSFSQTVNAQRIERSRRLLRATPRRPIAEIADACGFGSLATFYRVFNASEGLSPGAFRNQREPCGPSAPVPSALETAAHLTVK